MHDLPDRMPALRTEQMDEAQRRAAEALEAGPRKGVKGPFIALMRSPELMDRLQRVGEYLRFQSALPSRLSEWATLVVSRAWTQQFEWAVHVPLALQQGTQRDTVNALRAGQRPATMSDDEALVYDFIIELCAHRGVCDATYQQALTRLGERGVMDLIGVVGYFSWMSMVLNVAHTPAQAGQNEVPLPALPR